MKSNMQTAFGVDIGGTNVVVALVDLREGVVVADRAFSSKQYKSFRGLVGRISRLCSELESAVEVSAEAMGIGSPGVISPDGVVLHSPNLQILNGNNLLKTLSRELNLPVSVSNDANAAAVGEYYFGSAQETQDFLLLTLGTGVGGGMFSGGRLVTGSQGMAAEVGHIKLTSGGPKCGCGKRGCLEAYVGANALLRKANQLPIPVSAGRVHDSLAGTSFTSVLDVAEIARDGSEPLTKLFSDMGGHLGIAIATLIEVLNPERVLLGGGVANCWDLFGPSLRDTVESTCSFDATIEHCEIECVEESQDKSLLGAAALALHDSEAAEPKMLPLSSWPHVPPRTRTLSDEQYLCLHLGASSQRAGLLTARGDFLSSNSSFESHLIRKDHRQEELITRLVEEAGTAVGTAEGFDPSKVVGVGVTVPAPANAITNETRRPPLLTGLRNDFAERLSAALREAIGIDAPVIVGNDANSACLAELRFGCVAEKSNVFMVRLCTGIGAGLMFNGSLYLGAAGGAGEFGHHTVNESGRRCGCGNKGCLETVASGRALVELAEELAIPVGVDGRQHAYLSVLGAAEGGNEKALELFHDMGHYLGIALASVVDLLNPDLVVLSGPLAAAYGLFEAEMHKEFTLRVFAGLECDIVQSAVPKPSDLLGALSIALDQLEVTHDH